jgi:hypothetical protein
MDLDSTASNEPCFFPFYPASQFRKLFQRKNKRAVANTFSQTITFVVQTATYSGLFISHHQVQMETNMRQSAEIRNTVDKRSSCIKKTQLLLTVRVFFVYILVTTGCLILKLRQLFASLTCSSYTYNSEAYVKTI